MTTQTTKLPNSSEVERLSVKQDVAGSIPASAANSKTTLSLRTVIQRLCDSRIDTVGDEAKPKSLVETFWLNELEKKLQAMFEPEGRIS